MINQGSRRHPCNVVLFFLHIKSGEISIYKRSLSSNYDSLMLWTTPPLKYVSVLIFLRSRSLISLVSQDEPLIFLLVRCTHETPYEIYEISSRYWSQIEWHSRFKVSMNYLLLLFTRFHYTLTSRVFLSFISEQILCF